MIQSTVIVDSTASSAATLYPVDIESVSLQDTFIEPRRRINRTVTIPSQFEHLVTTNRLRNFERVRDNTPDIPFDGIFFNDSDVYKWLEAASSALADPSLENRETIVAQVETVIDLIESAQFPDGYLNTYFTFEREKERYTNLRDMHELYCMGHFLQAAVIHFRATGSDRLLNVAVRVADHLDSTFGPKESGKTEGTCGHEEIEMGLVELYRATRELRYLHLAKYFIDARGQVPSVSYKRGSTSDGDRRYRQDHVPYPELDEVTGHAVRMLYLACGATDVVLENNEIALRDAIEKQWNNMVDRRSYISGGLGSRWEGEAFGVDYELPADRAYTETCAAIASVMWNHRLLLLTGDAKYADLMEHTLYNAVLPGISLSGDEYFYQNPLENDGTHRRQKWFGCACCPPNVSRLLAQLPGYFYATNRDNDLFLNLYAAGTLLLDRDGDELELTVVTRYPWDGQITVTVRKSGKPCTVHLRIPAWTKEATIEINGNKIRVPSGTYYPVQVKSGEPQTLSLDLPMPVRKMVGHPFIGDTGGRMAILRGPLLYCIEGIDNQSADVREIGLYTGATFKSVDIESMPGIKGLQTDDVVSVPHVDSLYSEYLEGAMNTAISRTDAITMIPYYAWANREPGAMRVWLPYRRSASGAVL